MEHSTSFHAWGPIVGIALLIALGGVVLAIVSILGGQYKDPEAIKYDVATDDTYPAEGEERPATEAR